MKRVLDTNHASGRVHLRVRTKGCVSDGFFARRGKGQRRICERTERGRRSCRSSERTKPFPRRRFGTTNPLDRACARRFSDPNERFVSPPCDRIIPTPTQRHVSRTSQAAFARVRFETSDVVHVPFVSGLLGTGRAVSRDYRFV